MYSKNDLIQHLINCGAMYSNNIIEAFKNIDRVDFVVDQSEADIYEDYTLHIGKNQTISQPKPVAMMMQMLDAAGIQVLSDGERDADESNPRGYYEHEKVKQLARDNNRLSDSDGTALKVIAQLLPSLPMSRRYRVIFMERDLREILASQRAMLDRLGKQGATAAGDKLADTYMRHIETVRTILKRNTDQVSVLSINYGEATGDPTAVAAKINAFLGGALDESAMAKRVSPALHNQRHV